MKWEMPSLNQEEWRLVTRLLLLQVLKWLLTVHQLVLKFSAAGILTDAQCAELASKLAGYWRKLAPKLGLAEEKVSCSVNYFRWTKFPGGSYGG